MPRLASALLALFLSLAAFAAAAQRAQIVVPRALPPQAAAGAVAGLRGAPVRFNAERMLALRPGEEAELTLPNGRRHPYVFELAQDHGGGIASWVGRHRDLGRTHRAVVTTGPSGSFGAFSTAEGEFRLVPGEGADLLVEAPAEGPMQLGTLVPPAGAKRFAPEGRAEPFVAVPGVNTVAVGKATPAPGYFVDLLIVYTRGLAEALGGSLMTRLHFLVTRANVTYADSEIAVSLRLVDAVMADYPDGKPTDTALRAITPQSGSFDSVAFGHVEAVRNQRGADFVALLLNGGQFFGNGFAWIAGPNGDFTYSATAGCTHGCEWVFIHELGHNMGLLHDRATQSWQGGGGPSGSGFHFGYAFCRSGTLTCNPDLPNSSGGCVSQPECSGTDHSEDFSDVMAYFTGTTLRNYKISNPNVPCAGPNGVQRPCGLPASDPKAADGAQTVNGHRAALSAIRSQSFEGAPPGSIQFFSTRFTGFETQGAVELGVTRVGGSRGAVQVDYATRDRRALSFFDYEATSGTLSWPDGDATTRTISIPLVADGQVEGDEAFEVVLSNPRGEPGVFLGFPSVAAAAIGATWPPGDVLPAGFVTPGASQAPWTVATDHVWEGTHSARSAQVYASASGDGFSEMSVTADFAAGQLEFLYRVSAYARDGLFHGQLDFFVDGAHHFAAGGESGWVPFAIPIAAGRHTLTWRFRNRLATPCNAMTPPAPGGANCADRAWIDALKMPLVPAAASIALASSPNPSAAGAPVTLTATVTGSGGTPTGVVSFRDGGETISRCSRVTMEPGRATCVTSALPQGTRSLSAVYSGDVVHQGGAASTLSHTVQAGTPPAITSASGATFTVGTASAFTVTATGSPPPTLSLTGALPAGVGFTPSSGALAGTPAAGTAGSYALSIRAANGVSPDALQAFTLTVVEAAAPRLALAPAALDFGAQSMGTTAPPQVVTLTNSGNATLAIGSISVSNAQFAAVHDCGALAPGASCTVRVTFSPAIAEGALNASTPVSATLSVPSNATGSPHTIALSGAAQKSLVSHYYRAVLRRAPDAGGLQFWQDEAARLASLGANVNEAWFAMAASFFASAEYAGLNRDGAGFVTDLYTTFFNRAPDAEGLAFWTGQLAQGMPREVALVSFMFSAEFQGFTRAIFGDTAARAEVDTVGDFYRGLLARLPDDGGFAHWVQRFRAAQCQGANEVRAQAEAISGLFIGSAEYAARARTNAQFVGDLYNAFLRRGGDLEGVKFWIGRLEAGDTRESLRRAFVASAEFAQRVERVVAQGCAGGV